MLSEALGCRAPDGACQRGSCRPGRAAPIARACAFTIRWEARSCSPTVPSPCHSEHDATGRHGHSRSSDLRPPYYRCAAARMVSMGSLVSDVMRASPSRE